MGKVILDIPRGEIVRILSQLSSEEREEIMREVGKEHGVLKLKPKYISIEEVLELSGIISVGGDALMDSERIYDE
ncbi:hypothetical protein C5S32_03310 [ANME-1 cluster archaeon GoMg1]|nr:hypothetical protein [ANME-1 cluster archaeon GoMg1]